MQVALRKLLKADNYVLTQLANNKKVANNLRDFFPHPYTLKDADFFIELTQNENSQSTFAITIDKELCGVISIDLKNDVYKKNGEIGYWLGESYWGKGIATKAVQLIINYGFNKLNLERIFAGVFSFNKPSMKVLENNNFTKEAIFKNIISKEEKLFDEHQYSIIKNDFLS